MNTFKLIFAEIYCRPVNFVLCGLAIVTAAALFVAGPTLLNGYAASANDELDKLQAEADRLKEETDKRLAEVDKQTTRIMRDLGVNLRIVHKNTNFGGLYTDFEAYEFDEDYVKRLADAPSIETIVHVVATLQHKMKWNEANGRTILLVGTLPVLTTSQKNEEKPHMIQAVKPGTVLVGNELAGDHKEGETIEINGHKFTIAKIMPQFGTIQDVQLVVDLHDAQKVAGKEGKINQIMALNCKCKGDRISVIRKEVEGVLPDTKVVEFTTQAEAREKQRDLIEQKSKEQIQAVEANRAEVQRNREKQRQVIGMLVNILVPMVIVVTSIFVGLMTWLNVRERRSEIGLLRAIGKGTSFVVVLFLGKAIVLGLAGGLVGCGLGYALAIGLGSAMKVSQAFFQPDVWIMVATIAGAPLIAAVASYWPTLTAVTQDPAVVLMDS